MIWLYSSVFQVNFIPHQNNGDCVAYSQQVIVSHRHIDVSCLRSQIEHYHSTLTSKVVAFPEFSQLLLACNVSDIELYGSYRSVQHESCHFHS